MNFTQDEREKAATALGNEAERLEREAKSSRYTGPVFKDIRAGLRQEAAEYRELAVRFMTYR